MAGRKEAIVDGTVIVSAGERGERRCESCCVNAALRVSTEIDMPNRKVLQRTLLGRLV